MRDRTETFNELTTTRNTDVYNVQISNQKEKDLILNIQYLILHVVTVSFFNLNLYFYFDNVEHEVFCNLNTIFLIHFTRSTIMVFPLHVTDFSKFPYSY